MLDLSYALEIRRSYSSNSRTQEVDAAYFYKNKAVTKLEYEPADIPK